MKLKVESYAGRVGAERPVRFWLDEQSYFVLEVLDQWYGPDHQFFRVRADDGKAYVLRHDTSMPDEGWELAFP